jgi:dimethylpropiothetin dethiomethylase
MLVDMAALLSSAAEAYATAGTEASTHAADLLRGVSSRPVVVSLKPPPADLSTALQALRPGPLKDVLARTASGFDWIGGDGRLSGRLASAELVGPDGIVKADNLRMGIFLQSPQTHYPLHSHAAEELYLVLAGTPLWQKDGGPFEPVSPGAAVQHLSYQRHSMKTERDGLLALWLWTGDLSFSSYQFHETE